MPPAVAVPGPTTSPHLYTGVPTAEESSDTRRVFGDTMFEGAAAVCMGIIGLAMDPVPL